jgi:hypothetical protein
VISIDSEITGTELAIAAATNVLTLRAIAAAIGAPGWVGGIVAASSMAIASDRTAAPQLQAIAGILSAPGALAVEAIRSTSTLEPQTSCCAPCAAGTECETK